MLEPPNDRETCAAIVYDRYDPRGRMLSLAWCGEKHDRTGNDRRTAGGAAIVTGAVVLLTGRRPHQRETAQIVPVTYDRGSGLAVTGRF